MKKYIVIGIMSLSIFSSCKDFLDTKPYDKITGDQTWASENLSTAFIFQIYADVLGNESWLASYATPNSARSESSTNDLFL